jgi:mRNA-degrading endonuclease toxin of MazEF toxin-antitoxin module
MLLLYDTVYSTVHPAVVVFGDLPGVTGPHVVLQYPVWSCSIPCGLVMVATRENMFRRAHALRCTLMLPFCARGSVVVPRGT